MEAEKKLAEYGLDCETYEKMLDDCTKKVSGVSDDDWADILARYNVSLHYDSLRKAQQTIFGGAFVKQYFEEKNASSVSEDAYLTKLQKEKEEIRKERIKLQTANIERSRIDRTTAKQEMYYEQVGAVCSALPWPDFKPLYDTFETNIEYLVGLADLHYGAKFVSENNEYSPEIAKERLEYLASYLCNFIQEKKLSKINIVCLGDVLQGVLRLSDLKINDTSVVKATVEISRLIAMFLNEISAYVQIDYYHAPFANHTQLRPLGSKASEVADEDLEYVIGNYIKDLCSANDRINVHLAEEGKSYIELNILGFEMLCMHGHTIKNIESSLKDISMLRRSFADYLIMGHFHGGKELTSSEGCVHDTEVLVCPSFVGSDPYADSLMKGSKAAVKIYGFEELNGHTETYKVILN